MKTNLLIILFLTSFTILILLVFPVQAKQELLSPLAPEIPVYQSNDTYIPKADDIVSPDSLNILLLGLDGRKGDLNPRCDAIHVLSYSEKDNNLKIISVPRGTEIDIPQGNGKEIVSNSCHTYGIDYVTTQIEKVTDLKVNYTMKVGFSQTLGILRYLGLPTTPALQFLRSRAYGIGDNQRSFNQSNFIKDLVFAHLEQFYNLPKPVKYVIFQITETDLPYETASSVLDKIMKNNLLANKNNIRVIVKPLPNVYIKDLHFSFDLAQDNWKKDEEYQIYQNGMISYLEDKLSRAENIVEANNNDQACKQIDPLIKQKTWLQVEDETKRDEFHFRTMKIFAFCEKDKDKVSSTLLDYQTEMQMAGKEDYQNKGKSLFEFVK